MNWSCMNDSIEHCSFVSRSLVPYVLLMQAKCSYTQALGGVISAQIISCVLNRYYISCSMDQARDGSRM